VIDSWMIGKIDSCMGRAAIADAWQNLHANATTRQVLATARCVRV